MTRTMDIAFGGARYRGAYLNAFDQFAALQAVTPMLDRLAGSGRNRRAAAEATDRLGLLVRALEGLDETQAEHLCTLCLAGLSRETDGDWRPVWDAEEADALFEDLGTAQVMSLLGRIIMENSGLTSCASARRSSVWGRTLWSSRLQSFRPAGRG